MAQARTPSPREPRRWLGVGLLLPALLPALAGCTQPLTGADMAMAMADMATMADMAHNVDPCVPAVRDLGTPDADTTDHMNYELSPGVCLPSGWCWENPLPQGRDLQAVWALAPEDVWTVTRDGTFLHYDGVKWSLVPSGTDRYLSALWGRAANDVWAVGPGSLVLHWDGTKWSQIPTDIGADLSAIWGLGADDVWIAGANKTAHWDGAHFSTIPIGVPGTHNITGLWGSSSRDVWATTGGAAWISRLIWHWDGARWKRWSDEDHCGDPCAAQLSAIWGTAANDIVIIGQDIARNWLYWMNWDGTQWQSSTQSGGTYQIGVWGSQPGKYWYLTPYSVDNHPLRVKPHEYLQKIHGSGENDVWVISYRPYHWDGHQWSARGWGLRVSLRRGWAAESGDAWIIGDERKLAGYMYLLRRTTGGLWKPVAYPGGIPTAVWGSGPNDVWFVGDNGLILRWDGSRWSSPTCPPTSEGLNGIFGTAADHIVAVGQSGTVLHWDGMKWSVQPYVATRTLHAVWGAKADDMWAGGRGGTMLHWDGKAWSVVLLPTTNSVNDIWGSGSKDVWAVSDNSMTDKTNLLHWDGTSWKSMDTGLDGNLLAVYGLGKDAVWAAGDGGMLHWDGSKWSSIVLGPGVYVGSLFGTTSRLWSSGRDGHILTYPHP